MDFVKLLFCAVVWCSAFGHVFGNEEADHNKVVKAEGQTAILSCTVKDLGSEEVAWRRTDEPNVLTIGIHSFTADGRIRVHHPKNWQWDLVINDVTLDDAGLYECQTSHLEPRRVIVELVVEAVPQFVGGDDSTSKTVGADVTLTCHMTGYPVPNVLWTTPDGRSLQSDSRLDERHYTTTEWDEESREVISQLHVLALETEDFGFYKCDAINSVGSLRHYVKVTQGRGAYMIA